MRDLIALISDGKHGSATSVDSTISRCNVVNCQICGGLWQGKMWVLSENGSLPMPIPSDVPGRYLPLADLIQSTLADGSEPSWRPSDLIAEAIHGVAFLRGLHDLTLESPAFIEVRCVLFCLCILTQICSLLLTVVQNRQKASVFCLLNFDECWECI